MAEAPQWSWAGLCTVPVSRLSSVGEKRVRSLAALGVNSVADLLMHYPRRYLDRTRQMSVSEMAVGEEATVLATVRRVSTRRTRNRRSLVEAECFDGSGYLRATFFNQPWRANQLAGGSEVVLFGKLETYGGRRQFTNPDVDLVGEVSARRTGRVVPVYPTSESAGLSTWQIARFVEEALELVGSLADPVPEDRLHGASLSSRTEALEAIHKPSSIEEAEQARRRLAFDELLRLQGALVAAKRTVESTARGFEHVVSSDPDTLLGRFLGSLPFQLTTSQADAMEDVKRDMHKPVPMHRLLQGDVGAGKTVVGLGAMLVACQGGHQAALLAPTEVLAEQHYLSLSSMVAGLEVPDATRLGGTRPLGMALLSGRTPAGERARTLEGLSSGDLEMVVGTHALLGEDVRFASLGLVVVDEQHRFGVEQRSLLRSKNSEDGPVPDVLVMTATPIPRTAAMTVYGDLDITVMSQLPEGRSPVETVWLRSSSDANAAWDRVRKEAAAGHRSYVVCPLVEGSDRVEARSAVAEMERLAERELSGLRLGLLHGQLPSKDKESVMSAFRAGDVQVLVATTVVEVGLDVPEATVMVVQDADRFGMAQLHQLRGRVGRSDWRSWCYLISGPAATQDAMERLSALESSTDGFFLAEVDLRLRGQGTVLGVRQQGRSDLKLASLQGDADLVSLAREVASELVDGDGGFSSCEVLGKEIVSLIGDEAEFLMKS